MGWLSGKSQAIPIDELSDKQIKDALKKGKVPNLTPKELKKMNKDDQRAALGEKGLGAIVAAAKDVASRRPSSTPVNKTKVDPSHFKIKGRGAIPIKDTMHPAAYKQLLEREAKRQGLL